MVEFYSCFRFFMITMISFLFFQAEEAFVCFFSFAKVNIKSIKSWIV